MKNDSNYEDIEFTMTVPSSSTCNQTKRNYFYSSDNDNLINILHDNQGFSWLGNNREISMETSLKRKKQRMQLYYHANDEDYYYKIITQCNLFHHRSKRDLLYQFKTFYSQIPLATAHHQVRKNLKLSNNKLIYMMKNGIGAFDLISHHNTSLYSSYNDDSGLTRLLSFDIKESNSDLLLCIGKFNGSVDLLTINPTKGSKEQAKTFNLKTGATEDKLTNYINYVHFTNDNKVAITSNDQTLKLYDVMSLSNKPIITISTDSPINHCDFNYDYKSAVCVKDAKTIDIFDYTTGKKVNVLEENSHSGLVIKFNPSDMNYFAVGNQDFSCRIWDMRKLNSSIEKLYSLTGFITDLNWLGRNRITYAEDGFFIHIYDSLTKAFQTLTYYGGSNGLAVNDTNHTIYFGLLLEGFPGIMSYELINNNISSLNNYDL